MRYVDSSVERLQVQGDGAGARSLCRHLQRPARAAAADRPRRASSSPACATAPGSRRRRCIRRIGVHAPLTFDLVDTWMERSLGGCQYHVMHPGGRSYATFPGECLRGREPAAARASSAWATRPGRVGRAARGTVDPSFPFTLDLRRT